MSSTAMEKTCGLCGLPMKGTAVHRNDWGLVCSKCHLEDEAKRRRERLRLVVEKLIYKALDKMTVPPLDPVAWVESWVRLAAAMDDMTIPPKGESDVTA